MTAGLFRVYLHIARRSGVFHGTVAAAAAAGAMSTLYPVGVRSALSGPGILGGLGLGVGAAALMLPFVLILLLLTTAGADEDLGLVREYRLAAVPSPQRWLAAAGATATAGFMAMWPAPITGALAGGGDAVRTSSPVLGSLILRPTAVAGAVLAALYFLAIAFGLLFLARNSVHVATGLPLGFGLFLALLPMFPPDLPGRPFLNLFPYAPVWSTALPEGRYGISLKSPPGVRVAVAVGWLVLVVVAAKWRLRRDAQGR